MAAPTRDREPRQADAAPSRASAWTARARRTVRDPAFWADWTVVVALIVLVVVFASLSDVFLTAGNVESILVASSILVVLAIGQTAVVATAGIDLSLGSILTVSSVVLGWAHAGGMGIAVACLLCVATGLLAGTINGLVVARGKITDFIVTLGMLSVAYGAALVISDGRPVRVQDQFLLTLTTGSLGPLRYNVALAALVAVLGHVVLFHTRFGTHLLATGGAPEAARAAGVDVARVKIAVYAISGLMGAIGGILLTARVGAAEPTTATTLLLNSVAAVVLGGVSLFGGRGSILGPVAGALLLTALINGLTLLAVSQFWQPIAVGLVVIVSALMMRFRR